MQRAFILFIFICLANVSMAQHVDITVAQDGSGDCKTITEAIEQLPDTTYGRVVIFIKNGIYHEKFRIEYDNLSLIGENRDSTIIKYSLLRTDWMKNKDAIGEAVVNIHADDVILKNLTIANSQPEIGPHAFAVYGRGTRTIIDNCTITSKGADTVSLWDSENGMYYHTNCHFEGAVDFVCPRGWCFISNSSFYEVKQTAAIWHAGSIDKNQKFVIKNSFFDGIEGFHLGRHHYEARFYLINCIYSKHMADKPIYRVTYPDKPEKNQPYIWGERKYFSNSKKEGQAFNWLTDNIQNADTISAKWTFDGRWDPENAIPPKCLKIDESRDEFVLTFAEEMTIHGDLQIKATDGTVYSLKNKKDAKTIIFSKNGQALKSKSFAVANGELLASQASLTERKMNQIQIDI
ncbi:pectinesterase family protein [Labilibaculum euxinus]|uniref:Pectin esterase n=1 Tax=Labilibaculum euxinus TaxID=2686357 RepID=A0A7M4D6S9_9BACT|nr:pectinesterase family protein [Labilibaculum euxinus]MUP38358.1 pectin esterase [Labilibaculum euxinus]MVB07563.1 pectin esterase [Labilibaculum euxinus]